jgi:soluble lytic murein transglycosylase-like protein
MKRRLRLSHLSLKIMSLCAVCFLTIPHQAMAELYTCNKNGTIVISSKRCEKKVPKKRIRRSKKTCFLEDRKTNEQLLVTNPTKSQLKRAKIIWCDEKPKLKEITTKRVSINKGNGKKKSVSHGRSLPKRANAFKGYVKDAADKYKLPEALLWAFMKVESDFIPTAVSRVGAQGLMQLMPLTAKDMGVNDSFNPQENIYGAAKLINILMKRFNRELPLVISAYHAGGGAVTRKEGIPYTQTSQYMTSVLNAYYRYMKTPPYIRQSKPQEKILPK